MTSKEMEVVAYLLHRRHLLYSKIKDDKVVDQILINKETRKEIKDRMGYSSAQVISNMLSDLRSKHILSGGSINRRLIPNYVEGRDNFKLILNFSIRDEA